MDTATALHAIGADAPALLEAAQLGPNRPIPHCPPWEAWDLVRHQGGIFAWMAAVVSAGERVGRRDLPAIPEAPHQIPAWYQQELARVLEVFAAADPKATTWTFSATGDHRVSWWHRRLAVETAVHRWDAQHAAASAGLLPDSQVTPVEGAVAGAGIEEFVVEFLPGLLEGDGGAAVGGTLHLHATDGPSEWWIDLDAGASARPEHAKADTALRGTQSDLLLWLYNRVPADRLAVFGPTAVVEGWSHLAV